MYIKHNSILRSIAIVSFFSSQAFEVVTDLNFGMHTHTRQFHNDYQARIEDSAVRRAASDALGYTYAEYMDFQLGVGFSPEDNLAVIPKVGVRFLNKEMDFGVLTTYSSSLYNQSVKFTTFLDVYYSLFYDYVSVADYIPLDVDYGFKVAVPLNNFLDMNLSLTQPAVSSHVYKYKDKEFDVWSRSSLGIGISWHLLADYGELKDEYLSIIQEPISIPRIDLVEAPNFEEQADVAPVSLPEDIEEVEEPLGWFAWIIEWIARLFRF